MIYRKGDKARYIEKFLSSYKHPFKLIEISPEHGPDIWRVKGNYRNTFIVHVNEIELIERKPLPKLTLKELSRGL